MPPSDTLFANGFDQNHVRRYLHLTARRLESGHGTLRHPYSQRYIDEAPFASCSLMELCLHI